MPHRARLMAGTVLSLFLSGCAHWPGPEHRAVTLEGIQQLLQQQAEPQPQIQTNIPTECSGLAGIEDQLEAQHLQINRLSKQVQNLTAATPRSEEHTSELQSREKHVCRLLLETKKKNKPHTE